MEKIIQFICENYQLLILLLACLLDLILFLVGVFKKGKNSTLEDVLTMIPSAIKAVEDKVGAGHGEEKKSMVMSVCLRWYRDLTGVELSSDSRYYKIISDFIEKVLETPTKKGDK